MSMALPDPRSGWRFTILAKFGLGFAVAFCCTMGLGLYAIERLQHVEEAAQSIRSHWLQTTRALGDISFLGQRFRVIEAALVLAPPEGKSVEKKTLGDIRAEIDAAFARQASLVQSLEEAANLAESQRLWSAYLALDDEFLNAAKTPGDAAATLYRTRMREAIHDFQDGLKKTIKDNVAGADASAAASASEGATARRDIPLGLLAAAAASLAAGWRLHRAIVRPIQALTRAMTRLAEGATAIEIPGLDRSDEIGAMARASAVFQDTSVERRAQLEREAERERAEAAHARDAAAEERERTAQAQEHAMRGIGAGLRALAKGDLERALDADFPPTFAALREDFEQARAKLATALRGVISSASAIGDECRDLASGAEDLAARTAQQAASLEESAAALQQITATVKASSASAANARAAAAAAGGEAKRGATVVGEAVAAMDGISRSAKEIREITGLIDEIAFQTNLLALNASVEAARAGEAGRGFAVVASEVRTLAQRSAEMARRISDLISTSGRQVEVGVARVAATGEALERIVGEVSRLDEIVQRISQGAADQATGIDEINGAVRDMDQVTQRNAAMVAQATSATRRLAAEVATLDDMMRKFRVGAALALRDAA
jgi:methyl-accepting chemotaxis protein